MTVSVGLDGYVDPAAPLLVDIEVAARSLVVGTLELDLGGIVSTAVEVPAGGVKRYELEGTAPGSRRQLTVRLLDEEGGSLLEQPVRVSVSDGMLVGLAGIEGVETAIRSASTTPLERSAEVVRIGPDQMDGRMSPLSYLLVGSGALTELDEAELREVTTWVRNGGRLYGPASEVVLVTEPEGGEVLDGTPLAVTSFGSGEIGVLEAPTELTTEEWSRIMRDRPTDEYIDQTSFGDPSTALVAAASSGQEATVPALPWLLAGILLFIVLVGPVNVIVLRAFGRPEWAWVTIPALSFVFLAAFWLVGRSQIVDFSANHAAVVIDEDGSSRVDAGVVVQVSDAGEHVLALPEGWQAVPVGGSFGGTVVDGEVGDGQVSFTLDDLGLGTTQLRWSEEGVPLEAEMRADDEGIEVTVTNSSPWSLWAWGTVIDGTGHNGPDVLEPGASATMSVRPGGVGVGYEPAVSEAVARRPYDETLRYDVVQPLALYAEHAWPASRERIAYVFGITDDRELDVAFDGRVDDSTGTTLLLRRTEISAELRATMGSVRPDVLAIDGASSVERYGDEIYAYGAESVVFAYQVPEGAPAGALIEPGFTSLDEVAIYDWVEGEFVPFEWGAVFEPAAHTSAGGELVVRAGRSDVDGLFDESIRLQAYAMRWVET